MDVISYSLASKQAKRIEKFIENPDSPSGILTVPNTIAAGETITVPAGRTAVLPNVTIDGTLNVEGDVFVPSGATFGDLESQIALKAPLNPPEVAGTAIFTNSTNNIALTGIGVLDGLEIGDVLQISGSTNNDTEFTVEVITDDDNVIVNQAHAGGTTTKSLVDETAAVTIKLLAKWYIAPLGLGQGWVDVLSSRSSGATYINSTNREIDVSVISDRGLAKRLVFTVDSLIIQDSDVESNISGNIVYVGKGVPKSSVYTVTALTGSIMAWYEKR